MVLLSSFTNATSYTIGVAGEVRFFIINPTIAILYGGKHLTKSPTLTDNLHVVMVYTVNITVRPQTLKPEHLWVH
jgi:hypothetical protein